MTIIQSIARTICLAGVSALVLTAIIISPARAEPLLTGVNVPNATRAGSADRVAVTNQLKAAGVQIARFPFGINAGDIDYAAQLYAQGIKIDLIVWPQFRPDAPMRPPYAPDRGMYPGHPLSYADPELSRERYQALLSQLDAKGVVLAGIELGNEINWSAFNAEFPLPGEGKIFGLDDLYRDPEGQQIARGLLQYLKILAVLKDVRDHSTTNRNTPIISAGLAPAGPARTVPGGKEDAVSIDATIQFLQRNGLDGLVDAYGIHFYPWQGAPFDQIDTDLGNNVVARCEPAGARAGKPCWVTEWGVGNPSTSCPFDDSPRIPLIAHVMDKFRALARQGRVRAVLVYAWNNDPWSDKSKPDPSTIFRCGQLSNAGKIALGTHQIVSQATRLCFNIKGNTNNGGEAIIPYPCGNSTNMQFYFVDQGSGLYSIHTVNGMQDLCLNISTAASSPGDGKRFGGPGNLIQWSCSDSSLSDNELFKLVDLGGGRQQIRVKNSGLCLEDPGSGGTIRQNVCGSSPNQTFTLTE